jgi:flavin-dependent dehydrogenase
MIKELHGGARKVDALIVGTGLAAAACAKRMVDAGYETVAIERKKLPRHKPCSGILSPRGHRFLIENFGSLPKEILHMPSSASGVTFHFPSMRSVTMDFDSGPTPHLHRKYSDHWAMLRSGAEIHDRTEFIGLSDRGTHVDVIARRDESTINYSARFVIGADGRCLAVAKAVYPDYTRRIPWFLVGQKFHTVIDCPLDDRYFHFWFNADLGHYTWSHARNGKQIVGVGFLRGENFDVRHRRVVEYLERMHHVRLGPAESPEIVPANFGPSLINRYIFGKGNVLITGQAAGFFNMIAEGMSCALHSGAIAGEAAVEAFRSSKNIQQIYRGMIASEVRRCSDQWNPMEIAFGRPHEADFRAALKKLPPGERLGVIREIFSFIKLYAPLKWGRQILWQSVCRRITGRYPSSRWL